MAYALTVDQLRSRDRVDRVPSWVDRLGEVPAVLPFERTVGDEFQGLLDDPVSVLDVILALMRDGGWHVGLGLGTVDAPLPASVRAASGPALLAARTAVEEAKRRPDHFRLVTSARDGSESEEAEVAIRLLGALRSRRSPEGWEAVDLASSRGLTQAAVADRLSVTRQAVGQRLQAAQWHLERDAVPVIARLLRRAERVAVGD